MPNISIIIIAKNEEANIGDCISSARLLADEVIVADSGSTDSTILIAEKLGARVFSIEWKDYGNARNQAAGKATSDWIFALDADERVTPSLVQSIQELGLNNPHIIYGFKRQSYFLGHKVRFGEWGDDKVFRLYNRHCVSWQEVPVHEELTGIDTEKQLFPGTIDHYTVTSEKENREKTIAYALLNAEKYLQQGKKAGITKQYLSPAFTFLKSYVLRLGFLDGKTGYTIAKSSAYYVWLKYHRLQELTREKDGG